MAKDWTGADLHKFREQELGLSMDGFCKLMRIEPHNWQTAWRWERGKHAIPRPVMAFLDVLRRSEGAREAAGLPELRVRYPYVKPGRPKKA